MACISLICAAGLPGAEDVDVPAYLARVKEWAALVRERIPRFVYAFKNNPEEFRHSQAFFFARILVQVLKKDIGVHYNPARVSCADNATQTYRDSRDLLIHGPLGPTLAGTCNNIPMAVVAVGRALGYPIYLAVTPCYVYAKWVEPNGNVFNVEASNPAGMTSPTDDQYRADKPLPEALSHDPYYMRPLAINDELALCMVSRG